MPRTSRYPLPSRPSVGRLPAIAWSWQRALVGAVYGLPAGIVGLWDPVHGLPLAVGVLPAAIIPIPPRRSARVVIVVLGVLIGACMFVGGLLTHLPDPVTALLLVVAVAAAAVATSVLPVGRVVLTLCVPLIAVGLSYTDLADAAGCFVLLTVGALYAWAVSLVWPAGEARVREPRALPDRRVMSAYGLRLGVAAGLAYLVAAGLALDHAGWAPAACLLVARPQLDLLQSRGIGRVLSVVVGAAAAALVLHTGPPHVVYAVLAVALLGAVAATAGSRWYVTSAFSTFFVLTMLVLGEADEATELGERVLETVVGVALAYLFTWVIPALARRAAAGGSGMPRPSTGRTT